VRPDLKVVLLAATVGASAATGCSARTGPATAFQNWAAAVQACDGGAVRSGMTAASLQRLDQMAKQVAAFLPAEKQKDFDIVREICKGWRPVTVESEEVQDDSATVTVKSDGKSNRVPLRREDGSWKVDFAALMKPGPAPEAPQATPAPAAPLVPAPPPPAAR